VRLVRLLWRALVAVVLIAFQRSRQPAPAPPPAPPRDPSLRSATPSPRAEQLVIALLFAVAVCAASFPVIYAVHDDTQLLGLALGLALALLAAAVIVAAKELVPHEVAVEERPELVRPEEEQEVMRLVEEGAEGVSRRRLLGLAAGAAGLSLGAALIVPAASLGPNVGNIIRQTPWRRGRRVVDERGRPISADAVETKTFLTGFPEGADPRELGSPVVIVKIPPSQLELPAGRDGWAPEGILAYSKICTHAACAISLYRSPLYEPTAPRSALVCPCHYSTFDVRRGAAVIFGPAGRPLPQLPLAIDGERNLIAGGGFSGPPGPAWLGTRRKS
jgi:ubiquinol-cytochrome c reductase iron-sulfur subunit